MTRSHLHTPARRLHLGFAFLFVILADAPAESQELTVEALHNTAYELTDPEMGRIELKNCFANNYETGRKIHGTYHIGYADFDGDGLRDAVTIVVYTKDRRSRQRADLVVMKNELGKPRQLAAVNLGDRLFVRELQVRDGDILLHLWTERVCDEKGCRYTKRELRRYVFRDGAISIDFLRSFPMDTQGVDLSQAERRVSTSPKLLQKILDFLQ